MKSLILTILSILFLTTLHAKPTTIAILYDGYQQEKLIQTKLIKEEITSLLKKSPVIFEDLANDWSYKSSVKLFNKALKNPKYDLIITEGYLSTFIALNTPDLKKPVVLGYDISIYGGKEAFIKKLSSKLAFFQGELKLKENLKRFMEISSSKRIGFIGDHSLIGNKKVPLIKETLTKTIEELGGLASFYPIVEYTENALEKLRDDQVQAVVYLPTWRLSTDNREKLIQEINSFKLPSFTFTGESGVNEGIFMTTLPASEKIRLARRIALNAQEMLTNGNNSEIDPLFQPAYEMIINETTAKEIGVDLNWTVLSQAKFIDPVPTPSWKILTLDQAAKEAIDNNLDLDAERYVVKSGRQEVVKAFSQLLPQINSKAQGRIIDNNTASYSFGREPAKLFKGMLEFNQKVYDDKSLADYYIQKRLQSSRQYTKDSIQLDLTLNTATAYLLILRVQSEKRVAQENLALSEANLRRAQERVSSGQARLSEVYRWESERAKNKETILSIQARLENFQTEFNRLLNRPLKEEVILEDLSYENPTFLFDFGSLEKELETPSQFNLYKNYLVHYANELSPEIKSLEEQILAQNRDLTSKKRAFYTPKVTAFGEVGKNIWKGGAGDDAQGGLSNTKTQTKVGVNLSYPLFTSGERVAEKNKSFYDLRKLRTDKESAREKVDQRVIQSIDLMKASFMNIYHAYVSKVSANKNLIIVSNSYERGVISIVDLLDAQNTAIVARNDYNNAIYDYLIDYMNMQRSIGQFAFLLPDAQKLQEEKNIQEYLSIKPAISPSEKKR